MASRRERVRRPNQRQGYRHYRRRGRQMFVLEDHMWMTRRLWPTQKVLNLLRGA